MPIKPPNWGCKPFVPLEPCPVRPTGFVPFSEYDNNFKYPLASSRKPAPPKVLVRSVCVPTLIEPGPDPEPPDCEFPSSWQIEMNSNMFAKITYEGTVLNESNCNDFLPYGILIVTDANVGNNGSELDWRYQFYTDQEDGFNFDIFQSSGENLPNCLNAYYDYTESGYVEPAGLVNCCEEPAIVCSSLLAGPYAPTTITRMPSDPPSWFEWGISNFIVRFPSYDPDTWFYMFYDTENYQYSAEGILTFPFENNEEILVGEWSFYGDDEQIWSCVNVSTYPPA